MTLCLNIEVVDPRGKRVSESKKLNVFVDFIGLDVVEMRQALLLQGSL